MESSKKLLFYQVLPRLFGNGPVENTPDGTIVQNGCGKFNDFDSRVLRRIRQMGFTHVWYTGVIRHATTTDYTAYGLPSQHPAIVKGKAGSPYAIVDYYDVDPDLAVDVPRRMEEFQALLDQTHKAGLKVIIDFVPNHVARQYHSTAKPADVDDLGQNDDTTKHFSAQNNFYYCWGQPFEPTFDIGTYSEQPARATGNDHFDNRPGPTDWYETVKLNYGIDYCDAGGRSTHYTPTPDTWHKMTAILQFWASKGIDGFRCDMAEMVPTAFWSHAISTVKQQHPELLFIAEVYNPALYREYLAAGFDLLYDKVGMYDSLRDIICHRRPAADITRQWQQTDDIRDHMLYFLENHDEQRIASDFFAGNPRRALPAVAVALFLGTNPYMHYAGQALGESGMQAEGFSGLDGRTTIFDYWRLDSLHRAFFDRRHLRPDERQLEQTYANLLSMASHPAIANGQFFDLMYANPASEHFNPDTTYAFLRKAPDSQLLLIVVNFADKPVECRIVVPEHAFHTLHIVASTPTTPIEVAIEPYGISIVEVKVEENK